MPWQKLDPESVKEIVKRYRQGVDRVALANKYGVSLALIDHHLRKEFGPRGRGKLTPEDRREIVTRWKRGEVAAKLAREFGVGHSAVYKLIHKETGQLIGQVRKRNEIRIPEDPVQLAYLAAMLDAEGCITRNSRSSACTWQVVITNTSPQLHQWLEGLGGNFYYVSRERRNRQGQIRQCFEWKVTTAWNIYRLLVAVLPYMLIKRERATEAIEDICRRFGFPRPHMDSSEPSRNQLSLRI